MFIAGFVFVVLLTELKFIFILNAKNFQNYLPAGRQAGQGKICEDELLAVGSPFF